QLAEGRSDAGNRPARAALTPARQGKGEGRDADEFSECTPGFAAAPRPADCRCAAAGRLCRTASGAAISAGATAAARPATRFDAARGASADRAGAHQRPGAARTRYPAAYPSALRT